jgi:hypothetical protein
MMTFELSRNDRYQNIISSGECKCKNSCILQIINNSRPEDNMSIETWRNNTRLKRENNRMKYGYWRSEDNVPVYCSSYHCGCIAEHGSHVVIKGREGIFYRSIMP